MAGENNPQLEHPQPALEHPKHHNIFAEVVHICEGTFAVASDIASGMREGITHDLPELLLEGGTSALMSAASMALIPEKAGIAIGGAILARNSISLAGNTFKLADAVSTVFNNPEGEASKEAHEALKKFGTSLDHFTVEQASGLGGARFVGKPLANVDFFQEKREAMAAPVDRLFDNLQKVTHTKKTFANVSDHVNAYFVSRSKFPSAEDAEYRDLLSHSYLARRGRAEALTADDNARLIAKLTFPDNPTLQDIHYRFNTSEYNKPLKVTEDERAAMVSKMYFPDDAANRELMRRSVLNATGDRKDVALTHDEEARMNSAFYYPDDPVQAQLEARNTINERWSNPPASKMERLDREERNLLKAKRIFPGEEKYQQLWLKETRTPYEEADLNAQWRFPESEKYKKLHERDALSKAGLANHLTDKEAADLKSRVAFPDEWHALPRELYRQMLLSKTDPRYEIPSYDKAFVVSLKYFPFQQEDAGMRLSNSAEAYFKLHRNMTPQVEAKFVGEAVFPHNPKNAELLAQHVLSQQNLAAKIKGVDAVHMRGVIQDENYGAYNTGKRFEEKSAERVAKALYPHDPEGKKDYLKNNFYQRNHFTAWPYPLKNVDPKMEGLRLAVQSQIGAINPVGAVYDKTSKLASHFADDNFEDTVQSMIGGTVSYANVLDAKIEKNDRKRRYATNK